MPPACVSRLVLHLSRQGTLAPAGLSNLKQVLKVTLQEQTDKSTAHFLSPLQYFLPNLMPSLLHLHTPERRLGRSAGGSLKIVFL